MIASRLWPSLVLLAGVCCAASFAAAATSSRIIPARTTIVSQDAPGNPYAESFLAVDPRHPASMIATALTIGNGRLDSALYSSQDAGAHWTRIDTGAHYETADPIVYFSPSGRAFFESERSGGLDIMTSDDGGVTWTPFAYTRVGSHFDRPYIGFDAQGAFAGRTYAAGFVQLSDRNGHQPAALAVASSSDGGTSFTTPQLTIATDPAATAATAIPADVVVEPDGTLLLPYVGASTGRLVHGLASGAYEVIASRDGGLDFGKVVVAAHLEMPIGGYRGLSVLGGIRAAVDVSHSRYRGRVYLLYPNSTPTRTDIEVVHSSDDGRTWSAPVRVNDNVQPADDANAAIWVNDRGVVAVTWNDRRASRGSSCYRLYASASLDGGQRFLPNRALSADVTCPSAPGNWKPVLISQDHMPWAPGEKWLDVLTVATRWPNGGDTQGLQSEPDGTFDAAWIDGASGVMQLAFTPFTVEGSAPAGGAVQVARASPVRPDLDSELQLNVVSGTFDPRRGRFSVSLQLENVSSVAVRGPFAVVFERQRGNLPHLRATNADARYDRHSAWILGTAGLLEPGASTAPREATWTFSGYPKAPQYPVFIFRVERGTP